MKVESVLTSFFIAKIRFLDTKTPYAWDFDAEDAGKMLHYMLGWRLTWSKTISATVTG
ncbi:MAG TPA: hypothetical protein VGC97_13015 [Pyrinomonadaceae bacterium]